MKSEVTKRFFGNMDFLVALIVLFSFGLDLFVSPMTEMFPLSMTVFIVFYDCRWVIPRASGSYELIFCSLVALAPLAPTQFQIAELVVLLVRRAVPININLFLILGPYFAVLGAGMITIVYSLFHRVPRAYLCHCVTRFGILAFMIAVSVSTVVNSYTPRLGAPLLIPASVLYLTEIILYLRTGWRERLPREAAE